MLCPGGVREERRRGARIDPTALGPEINFDVATENDRSRCPKLLPQTGEYAGLHVVLEDADACVRIVELGLGDLIEIDNMFGSHDAQSLGGSVEEERCGRGLATAYDECTARRVAESESLARLLRSEFDQVVVRLHKRHEPQHHQPLRAPIEMHGVEPDALDQKIQPLLVGEATPTLDVIVKVEPRNLKRRELLDVEGILRP